MGTSPPGLWFVSSPVYIYKDKVGGHTTAFATAADLGDRIDVHYLSPLLTISPSVSTSSGFRDLRGGVTQALYSAPLFTKLLGRYPFIIKIEQTNGSFVI